MSKPKTLLLVLKYEVKIAPYMNPLSVIRVLKSFRVINNTLSMFSGQVPITGVGALCAGVYVQPVPVTQVAWNILVGNNGSDMNSRYWGQNEVTWLPLGVLQVILPHAPFRFRSNWTQVGMFSRYFKVIVFNSINEKILKCKVVSYFFEQIPKLYFCAYLQSHLRTTCRPSIESYLFH